MKNATKIRFTAAIVMILLGAGLIGFALLQNDFDLTKFSTVEHEVNTHAITDQFHSIQIDATTTDVILLPSEDDSCRVICEESATDRHEVTVENDVLTIRHTVGSRELIDYIGINIGVERITVYLPASEYASLSVKVSTGNITISAPLCFESISASADTGDIHCLASASGSITLETTAGNICAKELSAASLSVTVSTGNVTLSNITCNTLSSTGNTGDLTLASVCAADQITLKRTTGDIRLDACDAATLLIQTSTGDVSGTLRSAKEFSVTTSTGRISVPESVTGGICTVSTTTGDIEIAIQS